ncbi:MAG: threonine/serine exporter family protein [Planctomycetota bacterium]
MLQPSHKLAETAEPHAREIHSFLLLAAETLHRSGTPSFRLEGVIEKLAERLEVPAVCLYTPTALVLDVDQGDRQRTYVRRVKPAEFNIGKLLAVDATLEALEAGEITLDHASKQLQSITEAPPGFNLPVTMLAAASACAGVAILFGGSLLETAIAGLFGFVITYVSSVFDRGGDRGLLEPVLGFSVALSSIAIAQWLDVNDQLITLAALILPIPGLAITIALTELALGHLSSGSARLAGAMVTLFTLVVGVAIAWRMTVGWRAVVAPELTPLPWWCLWLAVAVTPIAFCVLFRVPVSQWLAVIAVVVVAFSASRWVSLLAGAEVGAFCGALAVGCGSNAYARFRNRPAMITQTPGLLILVPGSIGFKSLTAMIENDTIRGIELAFSMSIVGVSLVGGLLLANRLVSPKRIL